MRSPVNYGVIGAALAYAAIAVHPLALAQTLADGPESLLGREMAERRIPGLQVAVVDRGRIAWLRSFGIADLQSASPVTDQTAFSINSCTKAFTGVAIMQLVEAGRVDLAAPVSRYVDGLPDPWQRVTIRQLLTHVSGLPDILSISNPSIGKIVGDGSEEAAWARLLTLPLDFPTGERFSYNQTNYVLLGKVIERLNGRPFVEAFADRQFRIAGMPHTGFGDSRDIVPGRAPSYRYV
ncbi:MAG: class A beta-lactamase-related serine hydrolase, partial [Acidobacteria bacterium]